ncbi:PA2779 family protein [Alteromonas sp. KS69]|uniref:PA2779 family protein n=2 Tax=Alteromonas TaxID=226 RepID=UPI003917D207|tara:strand:+ start:1655 stop:2026 length:372 start_codon:yes stop_codon:yes gene_type:complete
MSKLLVGATAALVVTTGTVQAEAVSSQNVMQAQAHAFNKQQLIDMVSRADVQEKLVSLGVSQNDAISRINGMTNSEISQLNSQLNDAPAGGVVGAVLTVLAIIAILDLVGVTDVYPFIRPINS